MHTGTGLVSEIYLAGTARIDCMTELVPSPGQYLLAHSSASDSPLATPLYFYDSAAGGFIASPPLDPGWALGAKLHLRGPLGRGFIPPPSVRKIALIAIDDSPSRMHGVLVVGLKQKSEIVVVSKLPIRDLPEAVEVQPLEAVNDILHWADFLAMECARENLDRVMELIRNFEHFPVVREAQILIRTPMPCGGLAECGVCAITLQGEWRMACKDGPVFILKEIIK